MTMEMNHDSVAALPAYRRSGTDLKLAVACGVEAKRLRDAAAHQRRLEMVEAVGHLSEMLGVPIELFGWDTSSTLRVGQTPIPEEAEHSFRIDALRTGTFAFKGGVWSANGQPAASAGEVIAIIVSTSTFAAALARATYEAKRQAKESQEAAQNDNLFAAGALGLAAIAVVLAAMFHAAWLLLACIATAASLLASECSLKSAALAESLAWSGRKELTQ